MSVEITADIAEGRVYFIPSDKPQTNPERGRWRMRPWDTMNQKKTVATRVPKRLFRGMGKKKQKLKGQKKGGR
ncbi:hypothetical protein KAJ83_01650 [Marivibrio halodurans]|uniref:Uncharacterized protein n=1 Tax=Marivibrio halodurans TaxID=2039722 RepID=A0A8J7S4Y2_9PROT|nr:hypothetical protein [Marivibrio halodurans]MBP5855697.1 hypothetical protein [Marivibrio halodurans]